MTATSARRLLLVHAHPDDESITTGGTIARYAAEGVDTTLVTCTLGEEGEIIPKGLDQLGAWAGDQLGGYRSGELASAVRALGLTRQCYLGGIGRWRDSGMAGTPSAGHPRAFSGGDPHEQATQLRAVLDDVRPHVVVTYNAFGGYGHPDHIRAHAVTMIAVQDAPYVRRVFHIAASRDALDRGVARLREEPGLPWRLPADGELPTTPDEEITTAIDVRDHLDAKIAALAAHETQISVRPPAFALSNGIAQPIDEIEHYVLVHGPAEGAERDLFGGL
ncbi:N-acetyl-1-D-myo-inositol-2-amino-2-deoxy-alpha-D-glucopyranoside deacetylase [Amycolatopsis thermalba]|uniref:1D-myo-inositol 2-acetamido-2-deoxy-alpha-D-glucopyranoside deacetylase n=1 Tax=Amycolatopsis thermalba TaxID=944492 RepID=A0ABY4P4A9_9PSEU|nr:MULTISPECIES: N-acetyl-1-D-myo-inositol-2-amino-2-deoxy-alpha-D-glucopyranoside deacetylase [Amycolatopsis]OXM73202.1 N-acetyl-1-D-myo-inositol-2-amino-2-deoxy-alpha-D-glucopyranoside deacetylase [Amycolatopsis sp. KNN50.9b]UQS27108.1 N-acetyl-1-D-myo-inositol-2-amino-2-deoxy-alpha-D-glucopyranoside deacetylase [Amycolatopsis thermalba]